MTLVRVVRRFHTRDERFLVVSHRDRIVAIGRQTSARYRILYPIRRSRRSPKAMSRAIKHLSQDYG